MRRVCLLLLWLPFFSVSAFAQLTGAQTITVHNHPQCARYVADSVPIDPGVTCHAVPIDFQVHWKPGNHGADVCPANLTLVPGLMHMHDQATFYDWGELGNQDYTFPIVFKLFCTEGQIVDVWAVYQGDYGEKTINDRNGNSRLSVPGQPWPYAIRGIADGLLQVPASLTFNPADGVDVGIPLHGEARISINMRVKLDNGDILTGKAMLPFYSVIDPSQPESPLGEPGINLAVHGAVESARDSAPDYQTQLTEFKTTLPILAPLVTPQRTDVFAYNYAPFLGLFPIAKYQMLIDPDFHMGVPGTEAPFTQLLGTTGNLDVWKPATIAKSNPPMGLGPNQHRLGFSWIVDTGNGFTAPDGTMSAGERLVTLITFPVTIGSNPTDDGPVTDWLYGPAPMSTPPPVSPPTCTSTQIFQDGVCTSPWQTLFYQGPPDEIWAGKCIDHTGATTSIDCAAGQIAACVTGASPFCTVKP